MVDGVAQLARAPPPAITKVLGLTPRYMACVTCLS